MDHSSFTEICLHQLKMSGVHEGEKLIVLTQGRDRLDYADAFMAAGQRLGARMYHMRLPAPPPSGGWNVGVTGLAALPDAVEALKNCDMLIDCVFLLFSHEQFAIQAAGTRILTAVEPPELDCFGIPLELGLSPLEAGLATAATLTDELEGRLAATDGAGTTTF